MKNTKKDMGNKKTVLILSGGLDSSICAYILQEENKSIYCLTFNYGQNAIKEIESAKKIAKLVNATEHKIIDINLNPICSSGLLDGGRQIGSERKVITYVPARNIIFLSFAAAYAETIGANEIAIGTDQISEGSYDDCKIEFMESMEDSLNLGCNAFSLENKKLWIYLPLVFKRKEQNIKKGFDLKLPFEKTWSCYGNGNFHCGECRNCKARRKAFELAKVTDPTKYLV